MSNHNDTMADMDTGYLENDEYLSYEQGLSNCCGAAVYRDQGICSECKEPCEVIFD